MEFGPILSVVASLILVVVGASLFIGSCRNIMFGYLSKTWPSTTGTITKSESRHVGKGYIADIEYSYHYLGKQFIGKNLGFGANSTTWCTSSEQKANEIVSKYQAATNVKVFIYPKNNKISVLVPGFHWPQLFILLVGIAWLCIGSFVLTHTLLR